ncbi:MAG TPA: hypothetical protein VHB30_14815 [Solirubrobacteraceae bacterium]|jgi:hypothetical protein|nr:hypothetical protein [Solirubrobacteraceae bacterium]
MPRRLLAVAAAALCLVVPATAFASGDDVIQDCSDHGKLTKTYSQKDYADALAHLPTDIDEYTDCRDLISRARLALTSTKKTTTKKPAKRKRSSSGVAPAGSSTPPSGPTAGAAPTAPSSSGTSGHEKSSSGEKQATHESGASQPAAVVDADPGPLAYHDFSSSSSLPTSMIVLAALLAVAVVGVAAYLVLARVRPGGPGA